MFTAPSVAKKSSKQREAFLSASAYMSAFRGKDGTGVFTANNETEGTIGQIHKDPIATWNFIQTYQYRNIAVSMENNNIIIGHARAKTIGEASHSNTHPFRAKHIVLAHNGTLRNFYKLPNYEHGITDSELIAINMAILGEKETLEMIEGAYALTWYNEQTGTFNIARNDERSLYTALDKDREVIYYMSDPEMLRFSLYQAGIATDKKYSIRSTAPGVWYTFKKEAARWTEMKFTSKKVEVHTYNYVGEHNYASNFGGHSVREPVKSTPAVAAQRKVIEFLPQFKNGSTVFVEIDDCYDTVKGWSIVGTALIDPSVKVVASQQKNKVSDDVMFFEATVTGKSFKNGQLTLFVDNVVVRKEEDFHDKAASHRALDDKPAKCGYCDANIPKDKIHLAKKVGECLVGECCTSVVNA